MRASRPNGNAYGGQIIMMPLDVIRKKNGTPKDWRHKVIIQRDGVCYYEEDDGSLSLCPWEQETQAGNDES